MILVFKPYTKDEISIGAFHFPDMKKPRLMIGTGNELVQYAIFNNDQAADEFMKILSELIGASKEGEKHDSKKM